VEGAAACYSKDNNQHFLLISKCEEKKLQIWASFFILVNKARKTPSI
jgi:hypothetical protein